MLVELAVDHLLRGGNDGPADLWLEPLQRHVGFGGRALDDTQRADDRLGLSLPTDLEIAEAALRLRAPVLVGGHLDAAEAIGFSARWRRHVIHRGQIELLSQLGSKNAAPVARSI